MRIAKLGGIVTALVLAAGTTAVLTAVPAQAANSTTANLDISGRTHTKGTYGDYVGLLGGRVTYQESDGTTLDVNAGPADLERKLPGGRWKVVKTDDDAGFLYWGTYGSTARGNALYRAHYLGGTGTDLNGDPITWDPSYSNVVTVGTFWKLARDASSCVPRCHLAGRIAPAVSHHKLVVQVKHHSWKRYKVTHTNRHSRFRVSVAATCRGAKYRIISTPTPRLLRTVWGVWTATRFPCRPIRPSALHRASVLSWR